jgi:hypothetical protein
VGTRRSTGDARRDSVPETSRRLLFGSSIEVVLSVLAYVALVTHLFVFAPQQGTPLLENLLGQEPPILVVYFALLVLWDVCYRIGTGWWASVAALWRSARYRFDPESGPIWRLWALASSSWCSYPSSWTSPSCWWPSSGTSVR